MRKGPLAILGAGGNGRVVADAAVAAGWQDVIFFDDRFPDLRRSGPWNVVGTGHALIENPDAFSGVLVGVGDNNTRWRMHCELQREGAKLVTVCHPSAWCSPHASIGIGTFVAAGVVINIGARVGACCIINTGATIDHDCTVEDATHLAPGVHVSGGVKIGHSSLIGVGASIRPSMTIGENVVIGAGSVVVSDIADKSVAFGNPAKPRT